MTEFAHLHLHTEYSLLDGACRIERLPALARSLGQEAVAITDHGVMYGVVDFYKACKKEGVKPILGCEVYVSPRSRTDRQYDLDAEARHLVLLCENETGYKNLLKLVSMGFTEGFYIKPRVDLELLRRHSEGIIALSACLAGEIPKRLVRGEYDAAKAAALELCDIFGKGNFFLELQDHGIPEQREAAKGIIRISDETGIPLVVTNDAHYLEKSDAYTQDVLMCIQTNTTVDAESRMRFQTQEFYVKSGDEMAALFPERPEACANTAEIARRCNVELEFGKLHLPAFDPPEGFSSEEYLKKLCAEGFAVRYPDAPPDYRERLEYETSMISRMGYVDYFLIVSDFIAFARSRDIPVGPGRGSAAGSIVSYCLGITDVDPMKYGLIFERFLNPDRVSMPDIDIDFCVIRRQEVIDYVIEKYGADHVSQIVTFGTMAARGAIRDVGRALGIPYAEVDAAAKLVPMQLSITIGHALEISSGLRELYSGDERMKRLIDTAKKLEGMPRHASTHAAGVVITKEPVSSYVPLAKNDEAVVTQFAMGTLEELGLLKMDFLGLRNLTVIDMCVSLIRKNEPDFDIRNIPEDDAAVFAMLTKGDTSGVFQLESGGITNVCMGLRPQSIEDITAILALYRPGPMDSIPRFIESKHNPDKVRYRHESLREILDVTYGCMVYQEQVMEIFRKLGGYSLGRADMVRRYISKKKQDDLVRERAGFIDGAISRGIDRKTAEDIFSEILDFANYAFNKAHAVSYAVISYQTAYLKCRYPREYMASLLSSVLDYAPKVSEYISVCREMGIRVLPPDINESEENFTVSGGDIRFGLAAVKNVGRGFVQAALHEREKGRFESFSSFCGRMFDTELNRRAVESLVKCGAFDSVAEGHRAQLIAAYDQIVGAVSQHRRRNLEGQIGLFSAEDGGQQAEAAALPEVRRLSPREQLALEKEAIGLYVSGHPLDNYAGAFATAGAAGIGDILLDGASEEGPARFRDEQKVTLLGVISSVRVKLTRSNAQMAYAMLEDRSGTLELIIFPKVFSACGAYLRDDSIIVVKGRISLREDKDPQVVCDEIRPVSDLERAPDARVGETVTAEAYPGGGEKLYLRMKAESSLLARRIKATVSMFPGKKPVILYYEDTKKREGSTAAFDERLLKELRAVLGEENVVMK